MKKLFLVATLVIVACLVSSCSSSRRYSQVKAVQDLKQEEKDAIDSLLIKIYKEEFSVTFAGEKTPSSGKFRPAMLLDTEVMILPDGTKLDRSINTLSMTSGFIWDEDKVAEQKIADGIGRFVVTINPKSKNSKTLAISEYQLDYKMATPGIGSSPAIITIIPITIGIE